MIIKLGLVVALPAEARALAGNNWRIEEGWPVCRTTLNGDRDLLWVRCGVGPERARDAARWLIQQKVTSLAVLGISGGLSPELSPGKLIVAESVLDGGESACGTRWVCQKSADLLEWLLQAGFDAVSGTIVSMAEPVLEPLEKALLYQRDGALAVDMESAAVVRTAAEAGLDCWVLRSVCDGANRRVPRLLCEVLDTQGRLRIGILLKALFRRPQLITDLLPMQRDFSLALKALRQGGSVVIGKTGEFFPESVIRA